MERVAFLVDHSGTWVRCLLNPETLVMQRRSGISGLRHGMSISGAAHSDDPVLFAGGGSTEIQLDLLFDVGLAQQAPPDGDVRHLSDPLWKLSEHHGQRSGQSPVLRLVWGKSWNLPGVITAAAQRLDDFRANGIPGRNWMRIGFRRIHDAGNAPQQGDWDLAARPAGAGRRSGAATVGTSGGSGDRERSYVAGGRIDLVAEQVYGDPARWREIAAENDLREPARIGRHRVLRIPGGR